MREGLVSSVAAVGPGGFLFLGAIVVILAIALFTSWTICLRYRALERELDRTSDPYQAWRSRVLGGIVQDAHEAATRSAAPINSQVIIEDHFQSDLGGLLLGERIAKAATGLVIILGLAGTFYGLTLSIGRLVNLVSGDITGSDVATSVTQGLTQALSGMAVAFSTSLFGVVSAIVLTVFGIFFNPSDRRMAVMVKIEHYLETVLPRSAP